VEPITVNYVIRSSKKHTCKMPIHEVERVGDTVSILLVNYEVVRVNRRYTTAKNNTLVLQEVNVHLKSEDSLRR